MNPSRIVLRLSGLFLAVALAGHTIFAQADITGFWRPQPRNQDGSGMIGDYAGVPISAAGRWRAESWSPDDYDLAGVRVSSARVGLLHSRVRCRRCESGRRRPGNAEGPGLPRAPQSAGAGDNDLDGWPASSTCQHPAYLERIYDRGVGRGGPRDG